MAVKLKPFAAEELQCNCAPATHHVSCLFVHEQTHESLELYVPLFEDGYAARIFLGQELRNCARMVYQAAAGISLKLGEPISCSAFCALRLGEEHRLLRADSAPLIPQSKDQTEFMDLYARAVAHSTLWRCDCVFKTLPAQVQAGSRE